MGDEVDSWPTGREEITFREARSVLDAQQQILADIDNKAMRTVRLTALLIGAVLTTWNVLGGSTFQTDLLLSGGTALFTSIIIGVATCSQSRNLILGPGGKYVEQLVRNSFYGRSWNEDYLLTAAVWIDENHSVIERNSLLLSICQGLLVLGLLLTSLAVVF